MLNLVKFSLCFIIWPLICVLNDLVKKNKMFKATKFTINIISNFFLNIPMKTGKSAKLHLSICLFTGIPIYPLTFYPSILLAEVPCESLIFGT